MNNSNDHLYDVFTRYKCKECNQIHSGQPVECENCGAKNFHRYNIKELT